MKTRRVESSRPTAAASRPKSSGSNVATRVGRLEKMFDEFQERVGTLDKRVTAMQAQLDHVRAK
jgi:phage-related tail protein